MSVSSPAEARVTVDDSDPETLLVLAGTILAFALISFGLARLARRLPVRIPTAALVLTCASAVPAVIVLLGFAVFVDDETFVEWIMSRAPRAYRNMALLFGASLLAAALGLRKRNADIDISTFD
jgi:hypothetical protein